MKTLIKYIFFLGFLLIAGAVCAQDIISFYDGEYLHLRWKGAQTEGLEGYKVYVDDGNGWILKQETQRLVKNSKIDKLLGGSTELFLKLAGIDDVKGDFTQAEYNELVANNEAYQFFGAFTGLNIKMAEAMGEYVNWQQSNNSSLKVKVATLINGTENTYIEQELGVIKKQEVEQPKGFNGDARNHGVSLHWKEAGDAMQTVGYYVYRSNSLLGPYLKLNPIGSISFNQDLEGTSYADNYLKNGQTYFYYITFFNAFGMESEMSEIIELSPSPQYQTYIMGLEAEDRVGNVELSWSITDSSLHYEIFRGESYDGTYTKIYPPTPLLKFKNSSYLDRKAREGVLHYYYIRGANAQKAKAVSDTILFSLPDNTPPNPPLNVQGKVSKDGKVQLSWDENKEEDLLGYEVERFTGDSGVNNFLLTAKPLSINKFTEPLGDKSQSAYRYVIFALDQSYNRSQGSEPIRLRRPDDIAPSSPILKFVHMEDGVVHLAWTASQAKDFDYYVIYRKKEGGRWKEIRQVNSAQIKDTLNQEGVFVYAVSAVDHDDNVSPKSSEVRFSHRPANSIAAPTDGEVSDSTKGLYLSWKASSDTRVVMYEVCRFDSSQNKFVQITELRGKHESFLDRYASNQKAQRYKVVALDASYFPSEGLVISFTPAN